MTLHLRRLPLLALSATLFLVPAMVSAASLSLSPVSTTVSAGTSFTEIVYVSSADQAMNAISGTILFPPDLLSVVSISKTGSVLTLWAQDPAFSNTDGSVSFGGVVPNPGYTGSGGRALSIQFRAKQTGTATVSFSPSSQVLANDGNGTDILMGTSGSTVVIAPATAPVIVTAPPPVQASTKGLLAHITSATHPDQTQWYKLSHVSFDWTNAQGVSAVQLGYDQDAAGQATILYNDPISHKELDLADGIWYFHVQEKGPGGWGPVSTYKVQIDTIPPLPFAVTFPNGASAQFGSAIAAQFTATDELSGIDHYQLSIDGKESTASADEGSRPYALSTGAGSHLLVVQAYDKAGNVASAEGKFSIIGGTSSSPLFTSGWLAVNYISLILIALAILGTLLFAAWYIHTHFSAYRRRLNHRLGLTHAHIHKEFDALKEAITEELLRLEQAKSARDLTRDEERLIARFKKLLDESERTIEKEIEDLPR